MSKLQVYRASAGSGKTYQLALKYIVLLLGQWRGDRYYLYSGEDLRRHRGILAITFTNKATQEMRSRIVRELSLLADSEAKSNYRRDLHKLVAPDDTSFSDAAVDRRISRAARQALDSMLFDLGEMQVSTIDAFFQRVLRSFAYEADLAGNYELMLENDRMTDMAITNMLALACDMKGIAMPKGIRVDYLRKRVGELMRNQVKNGNEYKIFSTDSSLRADMLTFVKHLSDEDYLTKRVEIDSFLDEPNSVTQLVDALKRKRLAMVSGLAAAVNDIYCTSAAEKLGANSRKMFDKIGCGDVENLTEKNRSFLRPGADYASLLNKNKFTADVIDELAQKCAALFNEVRIIFSIDLLLRNAHFIGLFREILAVQQSLKSQLNTILLSDTNELLRLIIDDSDTPFIYERIGRRLQHFLIDEFQDTSKMQWCNLLPLLTESLGNGNENLIIGDVKQCIYRFRNSNPELLAHDLDSTDNVKAYIDHQSLDSNWRSAPVIVNFNNMLFEKVGIRADVAPPKADAYKYVRQKAERSDVSGYVDIALTEGNAQGFERMLSHMRRELQSGYVPGDIAVLVRTRANAHEVVDALLQAERDGMLPAGTMVVSDEALYVASARSVQWIIAQLTEMNALPEADGRVNSRGLPYASQQDIDWLQEHLLTLADEGPSDNRLERVINEYNAHRSSTPPDASAADSQRLKRASGLSLFEIVEELIRNLPDESLRQKEAQYITAFQDLILDYCRQKAPTLQGFLKLWEDELADKAAVGLAEGVDAIRVMTIHKSKGLEFNCVHIPILDKTLDRDLNNRWYYTRTFFQSLDLGVSTPEYFPINPRCGIDIDDTVFAADYKKLRDDQTIDEINSLYVAFTRAKQELIISVNDPRTEKQRSAGVGLRINHPSGLLCPILSEITVEHNGVWKFGEPTRKYTARGSAVAESFQEYIQAVDMKTYQTRRREDMWSQTKAANVTDSGEIL